MRFDTVIKNGQLVLDSRRIVHGSIGVSGEQIAAIVTDGTELDGARVIDAGGNYVMPGVIDPHTHWGGFGGVTFEQHCETESRSAALGGVTTAVVYVRFPEGLTSERFLQKLRSGEEISYVDFAIVPGILQTCDAAWIETGMRELGVSSYKFFMAYKGASFMGPNTGRNELDDGLMYHAFRVMSRYEPTLASVHAENFEISQYFLNKVQAAGLDGLRAWYWASPGLAEAENALRACYLAERAGVPVYIVHLGARESLDVMRRVKQTNDKAYAETCPHYLVRNLDSPIGNLGKVSPPLRTAEENERCWEALQDGTVDCVGSDNGSTRLEQKRGTIWDALRGFAGTGMLLPILLSEGVNKRGLKLERVVEVTASNAAKLFGLWGRKGALREGFDADLNVVDLGQKRMVTADLVQAWSDFSIYEGMELTGWPVVTMLRGRVIARSSELTGEKGYGQPIQHEVRRREVPWTEEDELLGDIG